MYTKLRDSQKAPFMFGRYICISSIMQSIPGKVNSCLLTGPGMFFATAQLSIWAQDDNLKSQGLGIGAYTTLRLLVLLHELGTSKAN